MSARGKSKSTSVNKKRKLVEEKEPKDIDITIADEPAKKRRRVNNKQKSPVKKNTKQNKSKSKTPKKSARKVTKKKTATKRVAKKNASQRKSKNIKAFLKKKYHGKRHSHGQVKKTGGMLFYVRV